MTSSHCTTKLLAQLQAGDASVRVAILEHTLERFRVLAGRMFRRYTDLRSIADTDDVLQKALLRINRALDSVRPATGRAYFGLAARQIRWVLHDLARESWTANSVQYTDEPEILDRIDHDGEPSNLMEWGEFHEQINGLPDGDREMFDLLFYQGLTQPEASVVLAIPLRTLKRRWQSAKLRLNDALRGEWPSLRTHQQ